MGNIRKQTITSSLLVYIGVAIGAVNTLIFTRKGFFTPQEYGLTRLFFEVGQLFYCFASLSALPVLYKFYPYYKSNLPDKKNDLFTRTLVMTAAGSILFAIVGYFAEPLVVRKFIERSKLFVDYYHWVLVFGVGLTFFSLVEAYSWSLQKTVLPNFLRETGLRIVTSIFIALYVFKIVTFQHFIFLFSTMFFIMAIILFSTMVVKGQVHIVFSISRVTKKFRKKMLQMQVLMFGGVTIITIGQTIDGILIASLQGMLQTGIYTFAQYAANIIQIPQRSIQSISTGVIANAWKNKDYKEINRIYGRSSINMLILALFIFGNVWVNVTDGLKVLNIQEDFALALQAIMVIGFTRIIDAGTGVNAIIIGTSNKWKFEFYTGVGMLALRIPLAYFFVKRYGFIGSAYAELISLTLYNYIRFEFLRRTYNMQPFSIKTLYALLLGLGSFLVIKFTMDGLGGWTGIIARTTVFSGLMIAGTFALKLTPDAMQLLENVKKRVGIS